MKVAIRVFLVAFALMTVSVATARAAPQTERRYIDVEGAALLGVAPDRYVWSVSFEVTGNTPLGLQEKYEQRVEAIRDIAKDLKVNKEDLAVGQPYHNVRHDGETQTYTIEGSALVIQRDMDDVEPAWVAWAEGGFAYHVSRESGAEPELRRQARRDAAHDARDKAESIAEALGAKVGRPLRITVPEPDAEWSPDTRGLIRDGDIEILERVAVRFELE